MKVDSSYSKSIFATGLDPEVVEEILQRIDENLVARSSLFSNLDTVDASSLNSLTALYPFSLPPSPPNFIERIIEIRNAKAPYYVLQGNPIVKIIKIAHNLIVKLFGRKQAYFNTLTLNLLEIMVNYLNSLHEYNRSQFVTGNALLRDIVAQTNQINTLQDLYQQLSAQVGEVANKQDEDRKRLENLAQEVKGIPPWIDIIARKLEMLSLNVREALAHEPYKMAEYPEPRIVDPEKYMQRLSEMKGRIKINLGCGEKPLSDYINIDIRPLPDVDVIADVRRLPFDPGTVFEISSAHLVEHFREHHFRKIVLPYWKSLLMPGGRLRIICPNWAAMLEQLNSGRMSLSIFKKITFGAQDYEGDDHFAMYTPETLEELLLESGFTSVEKIAIDRMNGDCPEMELLAHL